MKKKKNRLRPQYDQEKGTMLNKEKVIKREKERYQDLINAVVPEYEALAAPLIDTLAFQVVAMMELENILVKKGFVERYQNGANQWGFKESSESKAYINLSKTCITTRKQIIDVVMKNSAPKAETEDRLMKFLAGGL